MSEKDSKDMSTSKQSSSNGSPKRESPNAEPPRDVVDVTVASRTLEVDGEHVEKMDTSELSLKRKFTVPDLEHGTSASSGSSEAGTNFKKLKIVEGSVGETGTSSSSSQPSIVHPKHVVPAKSSKKRGKGTAPTSTQSSSTSSVTRRLDGNEWKAREKIRKKTLREFRKRQLQKEAETCVASGESATKHVDVVKPKDEKLVNVKTQRQRTQDAPTAATQSSSSSSVTRRTEGNEWIDKEKTRRRTLREFRQRQLQRQAEQKDAEPEAATEKNAL